MLFFNITYKNETDNITNDPKEIVLNYKLNVPPAAEYSIYTILFCERTVKVDIIRNELILIT